MTLFICLCLKKDLYGDIRGEGKVEWVLVRTEDCKDDFIANPTTNFFPRTCCTEQKKHDKRGPGLFFKEEFRCREKLCFFSKAYCCNDLMTPFPRNRNSATEG